MPGACGNRVAMCELPLWCSVPDYRGSCGDSMPFLPPQTCLQLLRTLLFGNRMRQPTNHYLIANHYTSPARLPRLLAAAVRPRPARQSTASSLRRSEGSDQLSAWRVLENLPITDVGHMDIAGAIRGYAAGAPVSHSWLDGPEVSQLFPIDGEFVYLRATGISYDRIDDITRTNRHGKELGCLARRVGRGG
jgi:hypothetical protein